MALYEYWIANGVIFSTAERYSHKSLSATSFNAR